MSTPDGNIRFQGSCISWQKTSMNVVRQGFSMIVTCDNEKTADRWDHAEIELARNAFVKLCGWNHCEKILELTKIANA